MHRIVSSLFGSFLCLIAAGAASGQTRECITGQLATGSPVQGVLDANDCALRTAAGSGTSTAFAKLYRFTVPGDSVVTIDLTSEAFDTLLLLGIPGTPPVLLASNDNGGGHPTNSRIVMSLPAGEFTAIVSSPRAALSGAFQLTLSSEAPRSCDILPLQPGATEGSFAPSTSCRFLDLSSYSVNGAFVQFYSLIAERDSAVTITASNNPARFSIVATVELTGFRGATKLLYSMFAGESLVSVSSPDAGTFHLDTAVEDLRPCPAKPITPGSDVAGELTTSGCRTLDYLVPSSDATPLEIYQFDLTEPSVVTLDQTSPLLDTYLFAFDSDGSIMAENNNRTAATSDSRIAIHLPPGTYFAGASGLDEMQLGPFQLKLTAESPRTCTIPDLTPGTLQEGTLTTDGCRHLDRVPFSTNTTPVTPIRVNPAGRKLLGVRLQSSAAGQNFSLLRPGGVEVIRQPVDARDRSLTMDITLLAGQHEVLLWSPAAVPPTFSLNTTLTDPPHCEEIALGLNDVLEGTLEGAPCRLTDVAPYWPSASQVRTYRVTLPVRGRFSVRMEPGTPQFVPLIMAMAGPDRIVGRTTNTTPTPAGLVGTLPAGDYLFQLSTSTAPGTYTVRTAFQPEGIVSALKSKRRQSGGMIEAAGPVVEQMRRAAALHNGVERKAGKE